MVQYICLLIVQLRSGFSGTLVSLGGSGLGCLSWAGPIQHFREVWMHGGVRLLLTFVIRRGSGDPWLDVHGTLQLLNSGHVRER